MPIYPAGSINTSALVVPDLYVLIVPPQPAINGVPSNIVGVVGGASWGPLNSPIPIGSYSEFQTYFGALNNATYDAGTAVAIMQQQGASAFSVVRVSDGTDTKASYTLGTSPSEITFTALYSGTTGNSISVIISAGGASASWNVSVVLPGVLNELFVNITGMGNAFWVNVANAINNGQGPLRGVSQLISATASTGVTAATAATYNLTGGTNGMSGLTTTTEVGTNGVPRTGMYALLQQDISVLLLADATDQTQWSTILGFALTNGMYAMVPFAAGTSISTAITDIQSDGLDSFGIKAMHGDWLYWYDQVNQLTRLVSPASFAAGKIAALDPSQSSLNKQLFGISGSQTAGLVGSPQQYTYSSADLQALFSAGIDVICNPAPGGAYWAVRGGINTSLNAAVNGDNYTRLTNYIASTLNAGLGIFVGQKITSSMDQSAVATIGSYLSNLLQQSLLGDPNQTPLPYKVIGGLGAGTPNPQSLTGLGYYRINVAVTYAPINRFFIVALQGGQTVVTSQSLV